MRARALLVVLLAAGCSLPLPSDVHPVGDLPAEQRQPGGLQVIPPGPKPDASPVDTVLGFLGAQASSEGAHAVAREFLSPGERDRWHDDADVLVYDPDRLRVQQLPPTSPGQAVVRVDSTVSARLRADGSYLPEPDVRVTEDYHLQHLQGSWQLVDVPQGLRLTSADRQRAFTPEPVYYLAPVVGEDQPHLVPDQVFLPSGSDLATALVRRLLRGPSQALAGSVTTAVPDGTGLRSASLDASGVATVDLDGPRQPLGTVAQDLSAQLVWTLRGLGTPFRGLRLLFRGQPVTVPGEGGVQDAAGWAGYDPDRLGPAPPYFFTSARRLRSSAELPASTATAGELGDGRAVAVDAVAVAPDRTRVALLQVEPHGPDTLRVGPLRATSFPVAATGADLSSPTWGSGERGVWMLQDGRAVVRVTDRVEPVPVVGLPAGTLTSLAVSRDGVRVALVAGGQLYVGRLAFPDGQLTVVGLAPVLPGLRDATRVAWASSTELVVLGVLTRTTQVVRLAVDGSSVETLNTSGLVPKALAASPDGVLVVAGDRLYLSTGGGFRQAQSDAASAPAYPG